MNNKLLSTLALAFLLIPAPLFAQDSNQDNAGMLEKLGAILDAVSDLPNAIVDKLSKKVTSIIEDQVVNKLVAKTDFYTKGFASSLQKPPNLGGKIAIQSKLVAAVILSLLGIIAIFELYKLMIYSDSPHKRATVKESFQSILIIFILAFMAYPLYVMLIKLSYGISAFVNPAEIFLNAYVTSGINSLVVRLLATVAYFILTMLAWASLLLVKFMQILYAFLFPIGAFLYFLNWEIIKPIGSQILQSMLMIMFLPLLNTLIFSLSYGMGFGYALVGLLCIIAINWYFTQGAFHFITGAASSAINTIAGGVRKVF